MPCRCKKIISRAAGVIGNLNNLGRLTVSLRLSFCASVSRQKLDADLVTVNTYQLAAAIRQTRGGQEQKELFEVKSFERTLDDQARACL
jgi:hypothetical protein